MGVAKFIYIDNDQKGHVYLTLMNLKVLIITPLLTTHDSMKMLKIQFYNFISFYIYIYCIDEKCVYTFHRDFEIRCLFVLLNKKRGKVHICPLQGILLSSSDNAF